MIKATSDNTKTIKIDGELYIAQKIYWSHGYQSDVYVSLKQYNCLEKINKDYDLKHALEDFLKKDKDILTIIYFEKGFRDYMEKIKKYQWNSWGYKVAMGDNVAFLTKSTIEIDDKSQDVWVICVS